MKLTNESQIAVLASEITCNSNLFGDEVAAVSAHLTDLWSDAVKFGCVFSREIPTMWGYEVYNYVCYGNWGVKAEKGTEILSIFFV